MAPLSVGAFLGALLLAASSVLAAAWTEASSQTTVKVHATGYDKRSGDDNGCGNKGCKPKLTRDNNFDDESRWSCSTNLDGVDECAITYKFGTKQTVRAVCIGFYKGDTRHRKFKIIRGKKTVMETELRESAGLYNGLEEFPVDFKSKKVTILATPDTDLDEWFSLTEVAILVQEGNEIKDTPNVVTITSTGYDDRTTSGCGATGCLPSNTRDGEFDDPVSRWSCKNEIATGGLCKINYVFADSVYLNTIRFSFYKGDERVRELDIYINGELFGDYSTAGDTLSLEDFGVYESGVDSVEIVAKNLDGHEWLSINQVEFYVE